MGLTVYYLLNRALKGKHDYSVDEINNMYPFERDLYLGMIIKEQEDAEKEARNGG